MEELEVQCNGAESYPKNINTQDQFPDVIDLKHKFLDKEEARLFCSEERARIDFLEYGDGGIGRSNPAARDPPCLSAHDCI